MNDSDERMQDAGDDFKTCTGSGDVAVTTPTVGRGPFSMLDDYHLTNA